jgi:PAS domain S-box-containing protein
MPLQRKGLEAPGADAPRSAGRIQERLAHSLALMQATLEATADGILATDRSGRVTSVNGRYGVMWRIPPGVMATRDHWQMLVVCAAQFDEPEGFMARVRAIYDSSPPDTFEVLDLADGRVYERVSKRQLVGGEEVGRVWSFRDITRRMLAERAFAEERERLRTTLSSIADGVISTDARGRVTFMNPVAERLTGWTVAHAMGRSLGEVFKVIDEVTRRPVENPAYRALRDVEVAALAPHTLLVARDGTERPIADSVAPMRDDVGRAVGVVLVFRDVTGERGAEEIHARLASIVECSDDIIVSKTLDGVIRTWNGAAERCFGYTAEEAIGQPITIIIPPERLDEERMILSRVFAGERLSHFETVRRAKGGRLVDVSITVSPLRDGDGRIVGASKIARDITEKKRAEEELRDQRRVVDTLYGIGTRLAAELELRKVLQAVTDETTALSGAAFGAFFYNALDERGGSYLLYTLSGAPYEAFSSFPMPRATAIFEPTFTGREVVRLHDVTQDPRYGKNAPHHGMPKGHLPVKSYLAVPVKTRTGEVIGGLFFGHPEPGMFTERHEHLVVGVAAHAQVAIDNAILYEKLKEADRRKDEFLATLAHELRNPLAPMRTGLEILKIAGDGATSEKARGMMERQLGHMVRLVDDLLDLSRITRNKIELRRERTDLRLIVDNALEASRPFIDEGGHQIVVEAPREPVWLCADPTRVAQVISNLLNNAAKYTPRGGRIEVEVRRDEDAAIVRVRDNGDGIPQEMLGSVFDMFTQVSQGIARTQGGLGIGLTLVRRLVEMHGGSVFAHSEGLGTGSTFVVRLPLATEAVVSDRGSARQAHESTGTLRVLVVDDNVDAAQTLALFLDMAGHATQTAYTGPEALAAAAEFRPDVVLLDIGLPGMNGYEVARELRAGPSSPLLLVALTGWGTAQDRELARAAGFDHHLTKPADPNRVQALLAEHLADRPSATRRREGS